MARRKLYGAALAAYNKKRSRTSLARRGPTSVARRPRAKTRTRYVKVGRRRRGSSAFSVGLRTLKSQLWDLAASSAYGYGTTSTGADTSKTIRDYMAKLPTIDAIGKPASHGLLFHFAAGFTGGTIRRLFGHLSHAALMRAAYNFGQTEFDLARTITLSGEDDIVLSGEIGDDEIGDDDVD